METKWLENLKTVKDSRVEYKFITAVSWNESFYFSDVLD